MNSRSARWTYIDRDGIIAIPVRYDRARPHVDGVAAVAVDGKWGAIDRRGQWLITPRFDGMGDFEYGLAYVKSEGKYGVVDVAGAFLIHPVLPSVPFAFRDGLARIEINGLWGYIDRSGRFVIPPQFEFASSFSEGLAVVSFQDEQNMYFVDMTGAIVLGPFSSADAFSDGMALVGERKVGQCFIDRRGYSVLRIPARIQAEGRFRDGLAVAKSLCGGPEVFDVTFGYINRRGEWVIQPEFDGAMDFQGEYARIAVDGKMGVIDVNGNSIVAPSFSGLGDVREGRVAFSSERRHGFLDLNGNVVIAPLYSRVFAFTHGLAAVCLENVS